MTDIKRTLLIQVDDDGVREIFEPDDDLMLELGWRRTEPSIVAAAEHYNALAIMGTSAAIHVATVGDPPNGNGSNGHAIPDLTPLPREPAESGIPRDVLIGETEHGDRVYATGVPGEVRVASGAGKLPSERLNEIVAEGRTMCALADVKANDADFAVHAIGVYLDERLGKA